MNHSRASAFQNKCVQSLSFGCTHGRIFFKGSRFVQLRLAKSQPGGVAKVVVRIGRVWGDHVAR